MIYLYLNVFSNILPKNNITCKQKENCLVTQNQKKIYKKKVPSDYITYLNSLNI